MRWFSVAFFVGVGPASTRSASARRLRWVKIPSRGGPQSGPLVQQGLLLSLGRRLYLRHGVHHGLGHGHAALAQPALCQAGKLTKVDLGAVGLDVLSDYPSSIIAVHPGTFEGHNCRVRPNSVRAGGSGAGLFHQLVKTPSCFILNRWLLRKPSVFAQNLRKRRKSNT